MSGPMLPKMNMKGINAKQRHINYGGKIFYKNGHQHGSVYWSMGVFIGASNPF